MNPLRKLLSAKTGRWRTQIDGEYPPVCLCDYEATFWHGHTFESGHEPPQWPVKSRGYVLGLDVDACWRFFWVPTWDAAYAVYVQKKLEGWKI